MLNKIELKNFGPLPKLDWQNLGAINLVIGENGAGKTFLLKALYSVMRTIEEHKRGDDKRTAAEILNENLYWTFQPEKIGDLVTKGADAALSCSVQFNQQTFAYSFGKDTTKQISSLENDIPRRFSNSVFLPAKEVLSIDHIILKSRERDKTFGFDNTYLDLARAIRPLSEAEGYIAPENDDLARNKLEEILGGRVVYDTKSKRWHFHKGNQKFSIGVTAEGIKKIGILNTLLANGYLEPDSIVFMDEPESSLHPKAISGLLDIVTLLAGSGIQFFLASHSYFVVKKLFLIAQEKKMSIPVISEQGGQWLTNNLLDGMPKNDILDESVRLYKEEVRLAL
ncbi:MAG: ATP-binding protein [Candidatus Desulfovibrio kirbyi]|jgi:AAA15 family ATPase/GTPase|uniref:ATP-binding protein n=1 Tax=Candidatus Desulfovibrio kirbyi TaxID=2696086 RepID=A0A6L2R5P0_9BACT|nr:MAG: ATP-binding protein [Candidatus Desulfovibrio kirbyi]